MSKENSQKEFKSHLAKQCLSFVVLVLSVYACYITSGVYHEKILKHRYLNPQTGERSLFEQAIVFTLFPPLFATTIGFFGMVFFPDDPSLEQLQQRKWIPFSKALVCGLVVNFNMYTYNQAVVEASFPAVVMVKSCSLLSVILVGVFCSRVTDKNLKLKSNKILIGLFACTGIFVFNFFKSVEKDSADKPINILSTVLLVASLIGDGFLPDLQAQIKSECKPSVMQMYYCINRCSFLVAFVFCQFTGKIYYIWEFATLHPEFCIDMTILSLLNAFGQILIYKMVKAYKQHIPAFVIGIRKCLTVVVNILYFGHLINTPQLLALGFVFVSIMWETYDNYREKRQKQLQRNSNSRILAQVMENPERLSISQQEFDENFTQHHIDVNSGQERLEYESPDEDEEPTRQSYQQKQKNTVISKA